MNGNDKTYSRRPAEQELKLAQRAIDSAVVSAHYRLAKAYLEKLEPAVQAGAEDAEPEADGKSLWNRGSCQIRTSEELRVGCQRGRQSL